MDEGARVRRRRECLDCAARFTSYETPAFNFPRIVKADGRREQFIEGKMRGGILRALEKRPVTAEEIEEAIERIKQRLRFCGEREAESSTVGQWVMQELWVLDQVAYVRFASVHRDFSDVRAFVEEIERLENELPPELRKNQLNLLGEDQD